MVCVTQAPLRRATSEAAQFHFLRILPQVRTSAERAFRHIPREERAELVQEVLARVYCALARLVARGKTDLIYVTPLVTFALRQVRAGRRLGQRLNVRDVSSAYAQRRRGITLERLDQFDRSAGEWQEILLEDRRATPAEIVATRLDFAAWLRSLSAKRRKLALFLARGETTLEAAARFGISPARVSQLRAELRRSWLAFVGETAIPAAGVAS